MVWLRTWSSLLPCASLFRSYFACVLSAAVTHLIVTGWMGGTPYPTVGASGGIYGLLLAFGLYFPDRRVIREVQAEGEQRSEEDTSELQSRFHLVCRRLPDKT